MPEAENKKPAQSQARPVIDPAVKAGADHIREVLPHFDGSLGLPRHASADAMEAQLKACEEGL